MLSRRAAGRSLAMLTFCLLALVSVAGWTRAQEAEEVATVPAVLLSVDGAIGPATSDYLHRGLSDAAEKGAPVVILRIDTPGGLLESTRAIVRDILASPVPVVAFVAPSGAHAASAGTFLVYASHIAAMAPGTNLGAATPVNVSAPGMPGRDTRPADGEGDKKKDAKKEKGEHTPQIEDKAVNDAAAAIVSLAQLRGRNAEFAEKAVREAATLTAADALKANVIDLIAANTADLLNKINGRTVTIAGVDRVLETAGLTAQAIEPDWRARFLSVITNPNVAAILMMVGVWGIFFELYSPGLVGPGVVGAICLLLALYAFHVLPIDYTGVGLLLLGLGLMVAEVFLPTFGIIGIGGIIAFVMGAVMMMDTDVPGFQVSWTLMAGIGVVAGGTFLLVMSMLMKSRGRAPMIGIEEMTQLSGRVVAWGPGDEGSILIRGERWAARAAGPAHGPLSVGSPVHVVRVDGLVLVVTPQDPTSQQPG